MNVPLSLVLVLTGVCLALFGFGKFVGVQIGSEIAYQRAYAIKAERCWGEPVVTECVCEDRDARLGFELRKVR